MLQGVIILYETGELSRSVCQQESAVVFQAKECCWTQACHVQKVEESGRPSLSTGSVVSRKHTEADIDVFDIFLDHFLIFLWLARTSLRDDPGLKLSTSATQKDCILEDDHRFASDQVGAQNRQ